MEKEEFVRRLELVVESGTVKSQIKVLTAPPGRKPSRQLVEASRWYNELQPEEKQFLEWIIADTAKSSTFGTLVVLDGMRRFFDEDNAHLELHAVYGDGRRVLINAEEGEQLHDLVNRDTPGST